MSASASAVALQLGSSRRARAVAIVFSFDQHRPDDARGFGGECHHGDLVGPPREQIAQPWIGDAACPLLPQMGTGAVDQEGSQHAVALFGNAPWAMLAARRCGRRSQRQMQTVRMSVYRRRPEVTG